MNLNAGSFIVTLYGDAVVPREGPLWTGNIIEICERVGISETLVRTAVSRLVASGRLEGERHGRRSYYGLTQAARREFDDAARRIYGLEEGAAADWVIAAEGDAEMLSGYGFAHLGSGTFIASETAAARARSTLGAALSAKLVFRAELEHSGHAGALREFGKAHWPLKQLEAEYATFINLFGALTCPEASEWDAVALRLLLVHAFRKAALKDPALPAEALDGEWIGTKAREKFTILYAALSRAVEPFLDAQLRGPEGLLTVDRVIVEQRIGGI
ncbi:PaaX family transcriptional regulator C-terminal domain-containing protein [Oricola cellulosilytica]|nr:PaaX family transcriptional regulator C-terminal domain-containing protein [Oricola cellulosilytica]